MASSFSDFSAAKTAAAETARITPLEVVKDRSIVYPVEQIGNPWSTRLFDGLFHVWEPRDPDESAVSLVFVQSSDGNTVAHDPATLGGGETDKHLLYEGLTRVTADAVLSGSATAAGPDVFFSVWHPQLVDLRLSIGLRRHPVQVIVTRRGRIDLASSLIFNVPEVPVFLLCSQAARHVLSPALRARPWVTAIPLDSGGLTGALATLRRQHRIRRISAVGGRTTATALVDEGLVQELYLTTGSCPGGEPGTPWYAGATPPALDRIVFKRGVGPEGEIFFEHLAVKRTRHSRCRPT